MSNRYGADKPIKTKEEWDSVFEKQAEIVAKTLNITLDQARVRQYALLESGLMEGFHPDDPIGKLMIDAFLTSPQWDKQPKHFGESK